MGQRKGSCPRWEMGAGGAILSGKDSVVGSRDGLCSLCLTNHDSLAPAP